MTQKERRFQAGIINLLHNMSDSENNNENINDGQIMYYRGILIACITQIMNFFGKDFKFALSYVMEFAPLDSYKIIFVSLPENWREDWNSISYPIYPK